MSYGYVPDEENGLGSALFDKSGPSIEFAEQEVRLGFIRKVFGLLSVQLAITAAVTAAFLYSPGVKSYVYANQWTFWTGKQAPRPLVSSYLFNQLSAACTPHMIICLCSLSSSSMAAVDNQLSKQGYIS
eukprot:GHUV01022812.1.p2 GENE.GHUV01022812.1~~GHUV01022812.1.p2  ORF type:complete len:129 (-),score=7.01 GHUV01022812.1:764-1150(-)